MTRIDAKASESAALAPAAPRPDRRGLWGCGGCLIVFLLGCALAASAALSFVARAGVAKVPFLSDALYRPAEPTRVVAPLSGYAPEDIMATLAARAHGDAATGEISTVVTEVELTTLAMEGLREAGDAVPFGIDRVQIAVMENGLEIHVATESEHDTISAVATILPSLRDGKLAFKVTHLTVGDLAMPAVIADIVVDWLSRSLMQKLQSGIDTIGTLNRIVLQEGRMEVVLTPHPQ